MRIILEAGGIRTSAPTLSALGERNHIGGATTGLAAHARDLLEHLRYLDERSIVLVGHSYGGAVASEVAAMQPDLVKALVVLDGFTLSARQSIFSRHPELENVFSGLVKPEQRDFIGVPDAGFLGLPSGEETAKLMGFLRPMPIRTHAEHCKVGVDGYSGKRYYVRFAEFPVFAETAKRAANRGWIVSEIAVGHMGIVTAPQKVATELKAIVESL
jgi:pimeloyl-ACP methyl ester carboxylesterase